MLLFLVDWRKERAAAGAALRRPGRGCGGARHGTRREGHAWRHDGVAVAVVDVDAVAAYAGSGVLAEAPMLLVLVLVLLLLLLLLLMRVRLLMRKASHAWLAPFRRSEDPLLLGHLHHAWRRRQER